MKESLLILRVNKHGLSYFETSDLLVPCGFPGAYSSNDYGQIYFFD